MQVDRCLLCLEALCLIFLFNLTKSYANPQLETLAKVREKVLSLEQNISETRDNERSAKNRIQKIKKLVELQKKEIELTKSRLEEVSHALSEVEVRRGQLKEQLLVERKLTEKKIKQLYLIKLNMSDPQKSFITYAISKKIMEQLLQQSLAELAAYRIDYDDSQKLFDQMELERTKLTEVLADLKERQTVLELNRNLQVDIISKSSREAQEQLAEYQKLKDSELKYEKVFQNLAARQGYLAESKATTSSGDFANWKGKLIWPTDGNLLSEFGRSFDAKSQLHVYKKGLEIQGKVGSEVRAVLSGKVAYIGEMENYGKVLVIDHGQKIYTLTANISDLKRKQGEWVSAGEVVGKAGGPNGVVYFELRNRNLAVNPKEWLVTRIGTKGIGI